MKHFITTLPGCLWLAFFCTSVLASNNFYIYENIDSNTDGWIDRNEAAQRQDLIQNWHEIDTDNDGVIGDLEFLRYEGKDLYVPPYDSQDMDPGAGPL